MYISGSAVRKIYRTQPLAVGIGGEQFRHQGHLGKVLPMKRAMRASRRRLAAKQIDLVKDRDEAAGLPVSQADLTPMLGELVDAAISISGADFGDIQLLDPSSLALRIVAQRGFPQWWLEFWNGVPAPQGSCGIAVQRGERVVVEDVENSPIFTGAALEMHLKAGVRALQSTPISSRLGKPLGVLSTHYKNCCWPDERTFQLLDLLARQAADIIEHAQTKAALRANEERLTRMLDTDAVAVVFWDTTGTLVDANDTFLRMTGYTEADVQGHELTRRRLTPPEWMESSEVQMDKLAATGHVGPYDTECFLKDGSRRWMTFVGRDLGDGTIVEYCIDITNQKRMQGELERKQQGRDAFLSLLGHELKNPLTAISFAIDLLRSDLTAQRRSALEESIAQQVELLRRLVDDLLDVARISHGQITLRKERIDLTDFLQRVVANSRSFFADRGQRLFLRLSSEQVWFIADETRLEQIVRNLLHNASNSTGRRGRIDLSGAREGSEIVIRCKDNGSGTTLGMEKRSSEPSIGGPSTGGGDGDAGLGVGMPLVRQLAELQGGTVRVESAGPGVGTEIVVRLPLVKARTTSRA